MSNDTSIKIGELLVRAGVVTGVDLSEAEKLAKHMQVQFGRILIMSGCLTEHDLECALEAQVLIKTGQLALEPACDALALASRDQIPFSEALAQSHKPEQAGDRTLAMAELLADAEIVSPDELEAALDASLETKRPLAEVLISNNVISPLVEAIVEEMLAQLQKGERTRDQAIAEIRATFAVWNRANESLKNGDEDTLPAVGQMAVAPSHALPVAPRDPREDFAGDTLPAPPYQAQPEFGSAPPLTVSQPAPEPLPEPSTSGMNLPPAPRFQNSVLGYQLSPEDAPLSMPSNAPSSPAPALEQPAFQAPGAETTADSDHLSIHQVLSSYSTEILEDAAPAAKPAQTPQPVEWLQALLATAQTAPPQPIGRQGQSADTWNLVEPGGASGNDGWKKFEDQVPWNSTTDAPHTVPQGQPASISWPPEMDRSAHSDEEQPPHVRVHSRHMSEQHLPLVAQETLAKEREELARLEAEQKELERQEELRQAQRELERLAILEEAERERHRLEAERQEWERQKQEVERLERERQQRIVQEAEHEQQRMALEQAAAEQAELQRQRLAAQRAAAQEELRSAAEQAELERQRVTAEQAELERQRLETEQQMSQQAAAEQAETKRQRLAEQAAAQQAEREQERLIAEAAERTERERQDTEEAERRREQDRLIAMAAEKAEAQTQAEEATNKINALARLRPTNPQILAQARQSGASIPTIDTAATPPATPAPVQPPPPTPQAAPAPAASIAQPTQQRAQQSKTVELETPNVKRAPVSRTAPIIELLQTAGAFTTGELGSAVARALADQDRAGELVRLLGLVTKELVDAAGKCCKAIADEQLTYEQARQSILAVKSGTALHDALQEAGMQAEHLARMIPNTVSRAEQPEEGESPALDDALDLGSSTPALGPLTLDDLEKESGKIKEFAPPATPDALAQPAGSVIHLPDRQARAEASHAAMQTDKLDDIPPDAQSMVVPVLDESPQALTEVDPVASAINDWAEEEEPIEFAPEPQDMSAEKSNPFSHLNKSRTAKTHVIVASDSGSSLVPLAEQLREQEGTDSPAEQIEQFAPTSSFAPGEADSDRMQPCEPVKQDWPAPQPEAFSEAEQQIEEFSPPREAKAQEELKPEEEPQPEEERSELAPSDQETASIFATAHAEHNGAEQGNGGEENEPASAQAKGRKGRSKAEKAEKSDKSTDKAAGSKTKKSSKKKR